VTEYQRLQQSANDSFKTQTDACLLANYRQKSTTVVVMLMTPIRPHTQLVSLPADCI